MNLRSIAFAALLPMSLVACGDDDGGGAITPTGAFNHYVIDKVFVPTNSTEARAAGLDLDDKEGIDNQLGMVLGTLAGQGFDIQTSIDDAVAQGSILLLASLQTDSFESSSGAGLKVLLGDNAQPAPCTDPQNPTPDTCGKHLLGTGMFDLSPSSPTDAVVTGKIVNGTFNGGPGDLSLQISLAGINPIDLDLIGARAQLSGLTADGIMTAIVAGAVTQEDLDTKVIPAIQGQLGPLIARDCTELTMPAGDPPCGCPDGSTGKQVISLFDTSPKDCAITVDEIKNNGLIMSLLAPDVIVNGVDALSLGLKVTAKKGTFTVAGE